MRDLNRYSAIAIVLLVVLRLAIGWQLLYEGLWKIDTLSSAQPWTSAGYLKNSVGPLRDVFRATAGDPDELGLFDYQHVASKWVDWGNDFHKHYRLNDQQTGRLYRLLHGSHIEVGGRQAFAVPLEKLPVEKLNVSRSVIWFDPAQKRLYVDAGQLLQADEKAKLERLVDGRDDADAVNFRRALETLYETQKRGLGYLKKLAGVIGGNPEVVGNQDWQRLGKLEQYRMQLAQYEQDYAHATTAFEWDHLNHTWKELQAQRAELTGPVKALEAELKEDAQGLLATEQLTLGPVPTRWTPLKVIDVMTITGLTALGTMLILGLFSRFTAVMAAFMLFNFYMAMPPWPGVPEVPGTEHSFIVNKNLIEVFALLALAAIPTGRWFGLDGLLGVFFRNWSSDGKMHKPMKSTLE
ncbi:MAG: DoxX family protein [Planctomycetaceae bacterium]|nr:DoxX family protein [Planctomycetaceae bacterium]